MGVTARQIVVISNYHSGTLSMYPWVRERRVLLPNPLLHPLSPLPNEPTGPFTVGFAGQLEPQKRVPDLVRAVARIPDAHAVLVGDGKARGAVEAAVAETGTEDRVRLLGFREDAPAEFHRFHCLAIPSLRESFGLVALEAMARGLPIVACRSGALPEVLAGAALFFPEKNVEALAQAIERLKETPELRKILRERGLERVKKYRKDVWLDGVEALLAKVVEGDVVRGDARMERR
jgi:glycosyltransferase involved in cell wall biosynthesis